MLPDDYAVVKDQVAPCGIRCGDCEMGKGCVAEAAINLKGYLKRYDVPSWAHMLPGGSDVNFKLLDENLVWVSNMMRCSGCLNGGGDPNCPIRLCSREKGLSSCGQCGDLQGCGKFEFLGDHAVILKKELAKGP
jgi:hypothetical protein